jgi:hypothetical protein
MPTGTKYRLEETVCPTCGRDDFNSESGVRRHHTIQHDERLPNLICEKCGSKFYYKSRRAKCDDCIQEEKEERRRREEAKPVECEWDDCDERFHKDRHMNIHYKSKHGETIAKYPNQNKDYGSMSDQYREPCPNCGEEFINMGQHWKSLNCEYPKLSDYQKDLLRGILMSDASAQFDTNNNLKIKMTCRDFLEWLVNELSEICPNRYPILQQTSDEAKENAMQFFGDDVREDSEYKEKYQVLTRSHPFMNEFDDWYVPEKRYPLNDLELTPTVAKMWYCGDGCLDRSKGRAEIACKNEADRIDEVADLIRDQDFNVNTTEKGRIRVLTSDTPAFLDWMGDAPPDFDYKWL